MHRIDGPGATVDHRFTEGDPVGGVEATTVTDDWLNDVQEEIVSVLTAAGIAPVKGTQDQLLKAIRGVGGGVVGANRNVTMHVTAASASATITADQIYVSTALNGQAYRLASFNKTINLAATGAGGMDTGTAPVSGHVAVYAIYNPSTGASALLATNASAAPAPEIYGGANMPAGYTASALISVRCTTAAGLFQIGSQYDRSVSIPETIVFNNGAINSSITAVAASILPRNAKFTAGNLTVTASAASALSLSVFSSTVSVGRKINNSSVAAGGQSVVPFDRISVVTQQVIYMISAILSGTGQNYVITLTSYDF